MREDDGDGGVERVEALDIAGEVLNTPWSAEGVSCHHGRIVVSVYARLVTSGNATHQSWRVA